MNAGEAAARLDEVRATIARGAKIAGRDLEDVELIAVSKTHPAEAIEPFLAAGHLSFGENRVQEAAAKWPGLRARYPDVRFHLVGQLQSNKAAEAARLFDVIHSVDRPSLIEALGALDKRPACYLQVNIGDEPQKAGCALAALPALLTQAREAGLEVLGLMCIPPADIEPAPFFGFAAKLARDNGLSGLSMGMSGDIEPAVMIGSTAVRVGTALFGAREA